VVPRSSIRSRSCWSAAIHTDPAWSGRRPAAAKFIEVVSTRLPLRQAMYQVFPQPCCASSLGYATLKSAALVYLALHYLFVAADAGLTANLVGFTRIRRVRARIIVPSQRVDEIGVRPNANVRHAARP